MKNVKKLMSIFDGSHNAVLNAWGQVYKDTLRIQSTFITQRGRVFQADRIAGNHILVHTLRNTVLRAGSDLLQNSAARVMSDWDIISTSVVEVNSHNRTHWGDVGFILAVPPQNIIGTFERDVSFPNHIGNERTNRGDTYLLVDHYLKGINKSGRTIAENTYAKLQKPRQIVETTSSPSWNEVLVVGRRDINIYQGFGATKPVEVVGIYVHNSTGKKNSQSENRANEMLAQKLSVLNDDAPIFIETTYHGRV